MKKIAVIVLLISFSLRPAYHLGYLVYFELNLDYIVQKYCVNKDKPMLHCNGKCHLKKQMSLGTEDHSAILTQVFIPTYFQDYTYQLKPVFTNNTVEATYWSNAVHWNSRFNQVPVPPPKV